MSGQSYDMYPGCNTIRLPGVGFDLKQVVANENGFCSWLLQGAVRCCCRYNSSKPPSNLFELVQGYFKLMQRSAET